MISDLAEFSRQPLDFCVISIFCLHRALYTIRTRNFLLLKKSFLWKNQRQKKVIGKKEKKRKRKKNRPKGELAELHVGVQISNKDVADKPKFAIHN